MHLGYDAKYFHRFGKGHIYIDIMGEVWINPNKSKAKQEALQKTRMKETRKMMAKSQAQKPT